MVRRVSGLMSVGLVVLLAACGGGGGGGSSSGGGNNPPVDTTPDGITFTAQTDVQRSAAVTSNEITVTGINNAAAVSITGGEYSIGGGAYTSAAGTVSNNQVIRVRVTASNQFSTPASAVLTVGGVSATFTATTLAMDATPAAFQFARSLNAARDGWVVSPATTITDINVDVPVTVENGEYAIAGGAYTSAAGTIAPGQSITLRVRAGSTYSKVTRARLTVGGVTAEFEVTSELPTYLPDAVAHDGQDIVYLLNNANRLIFRWSIPEGRYLDAQPLAAGTATPVQMVYSPGHQKLFLGYADGAIRQIAVTSATPVETSFAVAPAGISALGAAGNFLVVQTNVGYNGGLVVNGSGVTVDTGGYYYGYSRETAWDAANSRIYYTRDGLSPNDLHYDVINQTTGEVTSSGESPYHGDYNITPPIRVSANGQYVLLGSGDIYAQNGLNWSGSVAGQIVDGRWFANGSLLTLVASGGQSVLRRLSSSNLGILEQRTFTGAPLRVVGTDTAMVVLVNSAGNLQLHSYVPDDDSDDDGVQNTADAFPLDRAASVDSDRDGYPDAWNSGCTAADSTTGLTLDAFPNDAACWLASHGTGSTCNYGATVPNYTPDQVVQNGDVVYLLSSANRRVYRWSISGNAYLNPYAVGSAQGFITAAPTTMALAHNRLYLGYASGAIRFIDVSAASPVEVQFANAAAGIIGLANAGNYLAVQSSGGYGSGSIYSQAGVVTDSGGYYYGYSREAMWDAVHSRLYYTREGISPNDLHYDVINQTTGEISSTAETPYHGSYSIMPPIRVSANGNFILLGSGDIYRHSDLNWSGSVGMQLTDARWLANGQLVTLTTASNQTTLRRLSATNLSVLEQLTFAGTALRVVGSDTAMTVLLVRDGTVAFQSYVPSDDSDGDGVLNTVDAFPLDRAASVDSDRDGYPDAWNAGRTQADSTTGLTLDAFPNDSACWLASQGTGGVCNYGATIPNYLPDQVAQAGDVVYLLSTSNRRVYRWSISTAQYLNPYVVGINQGFSTIGPSTMAFSPAHNRLYLGYSTGAIQYVDVAASSPVETPFGNTAMGVAGLAAVGNYLLAQDGSGAWATHYIFSATGAITDQQEWNYYSREYAWDANTSRVYFFRDSMSPNDLHYEVIDQTNGRITSEGETPYHGSYSIQPPIRVSPDGQRVLLGSGDLYTQAALAWEGSLGMQLADARWFANGSLVTLTTSNNQTTLRRLAGTPRTNVEQLSYAGTALRIVGSDSRMVVLLQNANTVQFQIYVPNDDSDGDGVLNTADAFPLDVAASVDTDGDGYPNAWNPGRTQADSTTGLVLDAFPNDSACWLSAHGSAGVCNYGATMPNYTPDQVVQNGDVVYLLSSANRRVYRWSISGAAYLNPYVVGINQGFGTVAPTRMAFSAAHNRLYLGYETGAIRYIDVAGSAAEVPFANTAMAVNGLASVGNFVLAQDDSGAWESHYIINSSGVITDSAEWNHYSREYAWDPNTSRVYFFRDTSSPNDLHYEVIDQATGQITSSGEAPYHGSYGITPPIRVSANGQYVLLGTGDFYEQPTLNWAGSLGSQIADARWFANGSLVTLATSNNQTTLRRLSGTGLSVLEQVTYTGQALRVVGTDTAMVVVLLNGGTVQFQSYVPNNDSDNDGVANTADAFPLDPAASVDTDRDGYPDAWNAGRSQADSTTGLALDAFPNDAACWLSSHGSGGVCNYAATIPNYLPDAMAQQGDVIYLLSSVNRRVYRRSISTGQYLNPYIVGINQGFSTVAPTRLAVSGSQGRLYLGYASGTIRYIDLNAASPSETQFANTSSQISGLVAAGNYLLAYADGGYIFSSAGALMDQGGGYGVGSRDYAWDPVHSRVYHFRDGYSPNDLHYDTINQTTGQFDGGNETPYHGSYNISPPIRVSADGQFVMLGSGDIYEQSNLNWVGSLGNEVVEAKWLSNGSLVTLTTASNQTTLRRLSATSLALVEQVTFTGTALRVFGSDTAMVVVVSNGGNVQFHAYVPNDDVDNDGVTNTADAFPLDVAASVDTDRDGYPDAWNAGRSQADSTTGLTLDAFPSDSACWLASHGSGGVCNYAATMPNYTPDKVLTHGDVVYLLSSANRRVYRWSMATGQYLNPYIVGINQGFSTLAPAHMAFSSAHQRLYLGYSTGAIRYLDVSATSPVETQFANTAMAVSGLASVGNYVLAQDFSGAWATHYIFNAAGVITDQEDWNYSSPDYAWDPNTSRVYFFRNHSPGDLHYEVINQTNGTITSEGESPYHQDIGWTAPIRVSADGQRILLGSGLLLEQSNLNLIGTLGKQITDARWKDNLIVDVDTTDRVEIRDANTRAVLAYYQYLGQPVGLVFGTQEGYLIHVLNGTTSFLRLPFYDQDVDTIPRWWENLYGLSDTNAGDAAGDLDGDGVSNAAEYANRANPTVADTDGDGLSDQAEIVTHLTDPSRADSDGDGLSDQAEIVTHQSDPWDTDSDNDGYSDLDEVLYGGNPNDPSGVPSPMSTYTQTFENSPTLAGWTTPATSSAPWALDSTQFHGGAASYRSAIVSAGQISSTRFRGFFTNGNLTFWAKVDPGYCCNRLNVYVNGVSVYTVSGSALWSSHTIPITLGIREIEWRFEKDSYNNQGNDVARIDDIVFTGQ